MSIENTLKDRSGNRCELCTSDENLRVYEIPPVESTTPDRSVLICETCYSQIEKESPVDENHWHCLNESMWSEFTPVQVISYRVMKNLLLSVSWAQDLADQVYFEDDVKEWADKGVVVEDSDGGSATVDSNGTKLSDGDTVTLIKDLVVKGAGFTAKRGTVVKNISLTDNPLHIEGRVNGTSIVLVSAYLKKA